MITVKDVVEKMPERKNRIYDSAVAKVLDLPVKIEVDENRIVEMIENKTGLLVNKTLRRIVAKHLAENIEGLIKTKGIGLSSNHPRCKCGFLYSHKTECKKCPRCGERLLELWADGSICKD